MLIICTRSVGGPLLKLILPQNTLPLPLVAGRPFRRTGPILLLLLGLCFWKRLEQVLLQLRAGRPAPVLLPHGTFPARVLVPPGPATECVSIVCFHFYECRPRLAHQANFLFTALCPPQDRGRLWPPLGPHVPNARNEAAGALPTVLLQPDFLLQEVREFNYQTTSMSHVTMGQNCPPPVDSAVSV